MVGEMGLTVKNKNNKWNGDYRVYDADNDNDDDGDDDKAWGPVQGE